MKKTIKTLTFAVVMVLSLSVSASDAFAKDVKHGRETAWTDLEPLPLPAPVEDALTVPAPVDELLPLAESTEELIPEGVTWE